MKLLPPALRGRRLLVLLRRAAIALVLLWAVGWLLAPALVKWQLQTLAQAKTGRVVTVESVEFSPWSLELTLNGLNIARADGSGSQASIARLYVDLELQSLLRLAPVVDAFEIDQPRLALRHLGEGRFDIEDVIASLNQGDSDAPMPRFSIFNIRIKGGELTFDDAPFSVGHRINALTLEVPFLSNIGARRTVLTRPHLAFTLNDNAFDFQAATTPFAPDKHTEIELHIPRLDVATYLPYWPARLPVKPVDGQADLHLKLSFEQHERAEVKLSGKLGLTDFLLGESAPPQARLIGFKHLGLTLAEARPLERMLQLGELTLDAPMLHVKRAADARLNFMRLMGALPRSESASGNAPWHLKLARLNITGAHVGWEDFTTRPSAKLALSSLSFYATGIDTRGAQPAAFRGSAQANGAPLEWSGQAHLASGQVSVKLSDFQIATLAPYLARHVKPAVAGQAFATLSATWHTAPDTAPRLVISAPVVGIKDLQIGPNRAPLAAWRSLQIEEVELNPAEHRASAQRLLIERPLIHAIRDADGRWMFEDWLMPQAQPAQPAPAGKTPAWDMKLGEFKLQDARFTLTDARPSHLARLGLAGLNLHLQNLQPLAARQPAMPVSLSFELHPGTTPNRESGRASWQGSLRLPGGRAPLLAQGAIHLERMPLHALEPYFTDNLNLDFHHADLSLRGQLSAALPPEGASVQLSGSAALEDLETATRAPAEALLSWKALNLRGLKLDVHAGQLKSLAVDETVLNDYFARVIVGPDGRINLQDLVKRSPATTPPTAAPTAAPPADIRFGPIALINGRVAYADRFIKPNYTASLSELTGTLAAFSNQHPEGAAPPMADVRLRGRAEGTATLEITGALNPLATPLALDIKGKVEDLELPPLSPYSAKYAGYGIERGKLGMDVAYRINPDGQLTASNQIILNQLQFGERIEGSDAPNPPVKLAVALLADRNGVIDINLPISGSINDPEFKLAPTIVKVIFNLIGKAITAPFSLLASALGGADALSEVPFAAGADTLDDDAKKRLNSVAEALGQRPGLKLTIQGRAAPESEQNALKRTALNRMLAAEKRRRRAREGASLQDDAPLTREEYPALIKAVYQHANITKPRNMVGLPKDLPAEEMETLLLASMSVSEDQLRELALNRSVATRDYLTAQGVSADRVFLGAPAFVKAGENPQPRAELNLGAR